MSKGTTEINWPDLISQLMKERGWSLSQLAEEVGAVDAEGNPHRNTVWRWTSGRRAPRGPYRAKLLELAKERGSCSE